MREDCFLGCDGYIYDRETGLYYLQSRYYNPEIGRFINADGLVSTGQGILGNNMFAYCNNNPVMYVDPYGTDPTAWLVAMRVVVVIVVVAVTTVSLVAEFSMPSQEEHYARNDNNTMEMPPSASDIPDGWSSSDPDDGRSMGPLANAHQFTNPERTNIKYVSPDGKMEAIYNNGILVSAPEDVGTYNFCPVNESVWGHYVQDVKPWIRWGNTPDDPTTPWQRMWALLGVYW